MTAVALLISVALAVAHVFAGRLRVLDDIPRSKLLSAAGGISVAYVFVQLLPELSEAAANVRNAIAVERGVYLVALLGLVLFYAVERFGRTNHGDDVGPDDAWHAAGAFAFVTYGIYNAIIGYLLVRDHETLSGLVLFGLAMGVHFVVNDHGLRENHGRQYHDAGRWFIAAAVIAGAVLGLVTTIPETVVGMLVAFIAGGVVLNVMKEELPAERESSLWAFLAGAGGYTALLLAI